MERKRRSTLFLKLVEVVKDATGRDGGYKQFNQTILLPDSRCMKDKKMPKENVLRIWRYRKEKKTDEQSHPNQQVITI